MKGSNITFILGAGASKAYGFPVSSKLKLDICNELGKKENLYNDLKDHGNFRGDLIERFREQFYFSNNSSIDVFLSRHPEYMEIGKAAIVFRLIRDEHRGNLGEAEDGWFQYIMRHFIDFDHDIQSFKKDKIRFVSFNYDRSLEQLLYEYVKHSFHEWSLAQEKENEIAAIVKAIPIVHIYGRFDSLDWENESGREYGAIDNAKSKVVSIANGLDLMRQGSDIDGQLKRNIVTAKKYIEQADHLVFLGFGFDVENLKLLGVNNFFTGHNIYASGFQLYPAQQTSIYNMFGEKIREKLKFGDPKDNCEMFLRDKALYQ